MGSVKPRTAVDSSVGQHANPPAGTALWTTATPAAAPNGIVAPRADPPSGQRWAYVTVMVLAYDDVRNVPLPDLILRLLQSLGAEPNFNNLIQGFRQREGYGTPQPSDRNVMLAHLSDAWAWLESHALVGPSAQNPPGGWQRVTSAGAEVASDQRGREGVGRQPTRRSPASGAVLGQIQLRARGLQHGVVGGHEGR